MLSDGRIEEYENLQSSCPSRAPLFLARIAEISYVQRDGRGGRELPSPLPSLLHLLRLALRNVKQTARISESEYVAGKCDVAASILSTIFTNSKNPGTSTTNLPSSRIRRPSSRNRVRSCRSLARKLRTISTVILNFSRGEGRLSVAKRTAGLICSQAYSKIASKIPCLLRKCLMSCDSLVPASRQMVAVEVAS